MYEPGKPRQWSCGHLDTGYESPLYYTPLFPDRDEVVKPRKTRAGMHATEPGYQASDN